MAVLPHVGAAAVGHESVVNVAACHSEQVAHPRSGMYEAEVVS